MIVFVNGQTAIMKQNTTFEFVTENSLFTGSDSYTLNISFPLKDCPRNREIFGHLERKDVDKDRIVYDCELRDHEFYKAGTLTLTEINEVEVKGQFLEGRSEQNYDISFDEIYINEMTLGYPAASERNPQNNTPASVWQPYPTRNSVALPWVNNTSGNLQNEVEYRQGAYAWNTQIGLTFQPYLLHILKKICQVVQYDYNFSELELSEYRYLLICNTLPDAWEAYDFAVALPHWSLTEFFEQLENFLMGEFLIDHKAKKIAFHFFNLEVESKTPVQLDKVVNQYTTEVTKDKGCEYIKVKNFKYAENDNRYWAYRDCAWFLKEHAAEAVVYSQLANLLQFAETLKESGVYQGSRTGLKYTRGYDRGSDGHKLFYAEDVDTYFIMFCYDSVQVKTTTVRGEEYHWYKYYNRLEPINQFGKLEIEPDAEEIELSIVPAWLDETDEEKGICLFMECGEMGSQIVLDNEENTQSQGGSTPTPSGTFGGGNLEGDEGRTYSGYNDRTRPAQEIDETDYNDGALAQSRMGKMIEKGEKEKREEYIDKIYVGYWDGTNRKVGKLPHPFTHRLETTNEFTEIGYPYGLSLKRRSNTYDREALLDIDGKKKYNFSFLEDKIPDVKAIFHIMGQQYLCEKITVNFDEKGMSKMMKGVFYRIV